MVIAEVLAVADVRAKPILASHSMEPVLPAAQMGVQFQQTTEEAETEETMQVVRQAVAVLVMLQTDHGHRRAKI